MLCPEVWNFPPPKVITVQKKDGDFESVSKIVNLNNFYRSAIIVCPDEINTPQFIEDALLEDSDFYEVFNCPLVEFIDPIFIQNFIKSGKLHLLSDSNCIIENCAAITPDGILTLHVLSPLYQTLGLEGIKCRNNYYEMKIDLKKLKNIDRVKKALIKMKTLNFFVSWVPDTEDVCPSSIAKYLCDKRIFVSCHSLEVQRLNPEIKEIPTLADSEIDEMVEWVGMLALGADLSPTESYISTYSEPECAATIKSSRISVLIVKGFLTPNLISNTCQLLSDYASSRELENYWASISIQSIEDSLWQWSTSTLRVFCPQNCSCNIFFSRESSTVYSIGQLKYS
ncbi:unnamed protein product, partial [Brenthis ino]